MTIEKLEDKHFLILGYGIRNEIILNKEHAKLSIQFAVEVLEEMFPMMVQYDNELINDKIQELKQYLDEK